MAGLLHAALAAAAILLLDRAAPPPEPPVIELVMLPAAPMSAAPEPASKPRPTPPPRPEPLPSAVEKPAAKPVTKPAPPKLRLAPATAAPSKPALPTPALATTLAGPPAAAPAAPPAVENYGAILHAWLQRFRDYPRAARLRRQEGVVQVALTLDTSGRLLQARIHQSSGFALLDAATLAMAQRAAPYPPPHFPPGTERTAYIVPVHYALQ